MPRLEMGSGFAGIFFKVGTLLRSTLASWAWTLAESFGFHLGVFLPMVSLPSPAVPWCPLWVCLCPQELVSLGNFISTDRSLLFSPVAVSPVSQLGFFSLRDIYFSFLLIGGKGSVETIGEGNSWQGAYLSNCLNPRQAKPRTCTQNKAKQSKEFIPCFPWAAQSSAGWQWLLVQANAISPSSPLPPAPPALHAEHMGCHTLWNTWVTWGQLCPLPNPCASPAYPITGQGAAKALTLCEPYPAVTKTSLDFNTDSTTNAKCSSKAAILRKLILSQWKWAQ